MFTNSGARPFPSAFTSCLSVFTGEWVVPLIPLFEAETANANEIAAMAMEGKTIADRRRRFSLVMKQQTLRALVCAKLLSKSFENQCFKFFSLLETVDPLCEPSPGGHS